MYNPGGNPWEAASYGHHPFVAAATGTFTGIPVSYDLARKTLAAQSEAPQLDEPWPQKEQEREAFVKELCACVLRRVYRVLQTNANVDALPRQPLPAQSEASKLAADSAAPTATVSSDVFANTAVFPCADDKTETALSAKLALSTPAHPDSLLLPAEPGELVRLIGEAGGGEVSEERAVRAARITTQWLRESYGDDSIARPTHESTHTGGRRGSQSKDAAEGSGPAETTGGTHQCNACKVSMRLQSFRVRCAECEDFDLCERCFCEGREVQAHKKEHYFIPIGPNQLPLFHNQWTADEELFLLDAVGKFGFGNWHDVAEQVSFGSSRSVPPKDKEACERRYFEFHLNSKERTEDEFYPFSSLINRPQYPLWKSFLSRTKTFDSIEAEKKLHAQRPTVAHLQPRVICREDDAQPLNASKIKIKESLVMDTLQLPPKVHILGFLPCRGDFEIEWENQAELSIADLEIRENESPMEKEVKLRMLEYYNSVLDDRIRRKKMMIEKRLYDTKLTQQLDRMRTPEEKALHELLKPLWKHFYTPYMESKSPLFTVDRKIKTLSPSITEHELDELTHLLLEDETLIDRLNKLTLWRQQGLKTLEQVLNFDSQNTTEDTTKVQSTSTGGSSNFGQVAKLKPGKHNLSPLEANICDELQVREEFLSYIKKMVQQEVESSCAITIDPETGLKVLQMEDGDMVSLNDFIVDAHIELNADILQKGDKARDTETETGRANGVSSSDTALSGSGLVIPRKRKQPANKQPVSAPRLSPPAADTASEMQASSDHSLLPSLESVTHLESSTHISASPSTLVHTDMMPAAQLMREEPHGSQSLYVSPMASELCPASPSSDGGLLETEEGEIEEDDLPPGDGVSVLLKPPPPPPYPQQRSRSLADRGLGKGGKAEKRARRGSGGLGLTALATMAESDEDDGSVGGDAAAGEEDSQKKSYSLLSSDVQAPSDEDLLN